MRTRHHLPGARFLFCLTSISASLAACGGETGDSTDTDRLGSTQQALNGTVTETWANDVAASQTIVTTSGNTWTAGWTAGNWRTNDSPGVRPTTDSASVSDGTPVVFGNNTAADNTLTTGDGTAANVTVSTQVTNADNDPMAVIVRYANASNFYACYMTRDADFASGPVGGATVAAHYEGNGRAPTAVLVRVRNGVPQVLARQDDLANNLFAAGETYSITVTATGNAISCALDSGNNGTVNVTLNATDATNPIPAGKIGLLAWDEGENTNTSYFDNISATISDTFAPDTSFVSTPPAVSNSSSGTFTFTSNEAPDVTYQCSLDNAAFTACTSGINVNGLADGQHTFRVRAVDQPNSNVDPTPASYTWTVDTTAPNTGIQTGPAEGSTQASTSATFDFTSPEAGVTYECSVDGGAFASCTDPVTFTNLGQGAHTLAVRAKDAAGNVDPTPATRGWTVDTVLPDTTIAAGPLEGSTQTSTTANFTFTSPEAGVTFECSLDNAAFVACPASTSFTNLGQGPHTLAVRAKDAAGNVDPTPATRAWSVDTVAPDTTIQSGPLPGSTQASTTADFTFTSPDATATFECSLDNAAFTACPASTTFAGLAQGPHTLAVRAKDAAGNVDPTPATRTWTVDTVGPDTTIQSGPPAGSTQTSTTANFTFTSPESPVTFECNLDNAGFVSCPASQSYSNLAQGSHTLQVRAKDAVGNVDTTPATRTWTVDTVGPDTTIASGPPAGSTQTSTTANFTFTSPESPVTFECNLDNGGFVPCTASQAFTGLGQGPHTLQVRAKDAVGNVDESPATRTWSVDTVAPDTTIQSGPGEGSTQASATANFDFSSPDAGATFECKLDGAAVFTPCTDPAQFTGLANGPHTLQVRARDAAGNVDPTPATRSWIVDTVEVDTSFVSTPPVNSASTTGTFDFSSNKSPVTFECNLDNAGFVACTDPVSFTNLAQGPHTLLVRARDVANSVDPTPASYTWNVDTQAPDTAIAVGSPGTELEFAL